MSLGKNKVTLANFLTEVIPLLVEHGLGDSLLTILDSTVLSFTDATVTNVNVDHASAIVKAKWKLEFTPSFTQTGSVFDLVIFYDMMYGHSKRISGTDQTIFALEFSINDISYSAIDSIQTQFGDNDSFLNVITNGQVFDLRSNIPPFYFRLVLYNSTGTDVNTWEDLEFQMLLVFVKNWIITQLI